MTDPADIETTWLPSFMLMQPVSDAGRDWIAENCDYPAALVSGGVPVEHRYVSEIIEAAVEDGLAVMDTETGRMAVVP